MSELTAERLRELLHYDPETGVFTRLVARQAYPVGSVAGYQGTNGYIRVGLDGKSYRAHRLAWLYVYGRWPQDEVDHVDGVRSNNMFANLRECSRSENNQNRTAYACNAEGLLGVTWHRASKAWVAQIKVEGRTTHLGRFDTPKQAHAAYLAAKQQLHTFQPTPRITTTKAQNDPIFTAARSARNR